jgi:hypothetical protein
VLGQAQTVIERHPRPFVHLVPRSERRHHDAGVCGSHTAGVLAPHPLESRAHFFGGQLRQPGLGDRDHPLAAFLQPHWRGGDLDFQAAVAGPNLQLLSWLQAERNSQGFGNDKPAGSVEGSFHGKYFAIKMAF